MWLVSLPLSVRVSDKKTFSLNLNQYRNTHHYSLNTAKVNYEGLVRRLLKNLGLPKLQKIKLIYTLYPKTGISLDTSNICCIVEKFFCDSLVKAKIIPDDNFNHVIESVYRYGEVDKANPRVDVLIIPHEGDKSDIDMKIILTNEEVLAALQDHISNMIQISEDTDVSLELLEDGSVEVILSKDGEETTDKPDTTRKTTRRRRRTKAEIEADKAAEEAQKEESKEEEEEQPAFEPTNKTDLAGPGSLFPDDDDEDAGMNTPAKEEPETADLPEASDLFKDN